MFSKKYFYCFITILFLGLTIHLPLSKTNLVISNYDSRLVENSQSYDSIDYLIITDESFQAELEPLAIWKTQKGLISTIKTVQDIIQEYLGSNTPAKIKNCIIDYYETYNTQWVLLAGDQAHVPSQDVRCDDGFPYDGDYVSCDSYYADLNNNWDLNHDNIWGTSSDEYDFEAEVYIGRLTANNKNQMANLVQNILDYEKNPPLGSWMTRALFAGSILQFDQDWNNDSVVDYGECDANRVNNFMKNLLPSNWTSFFLAQTEGIKASDNYTDIQLNYNNLKNEINKGSSIGTIFAHGYPQGMGIDKWVMDYDGDMLFDYTDDPYEGGGTPIDLSERTNLIDTSYAMLDPNDKLGLFYLGSCSTGTFDDASDCLAEYFLKNAAIGCIAASQVTWGEDQWYERNHGGWFMEGLGYRLWEQVFQYNQPGKALALAKEDYVLDRSYSPELNDYPEWEDKTLKQYNLLGDPEVPIWLSVPEQLNISTIQNSNSSILNLLITAEDNPIQGVTITYTKNNNLIWKGETNENGTVEVPISQININGKTITASKNRFLPFQEVLEGSGEVDAIAGYEVIFIIFALLSVIGISIFYYYRTSITKKKVI